MCQIVISIKGAPTSKRGGKYFILPLSNSTNAVGYMRSSSSIINWN